MKEKEKGRIKRIVIRGVLISAVAAVCCICIVMSILFFYRPKLPETQSVQFAKGLGRGWNLGNTLEAWRIPEPEDTETCWGNPKTTDELIKLVKELGFTSVRIPVTWFQHMDEDYNIEPEWLDRVNEIVDYVLAEDMYAVINVQHDDQDWLVTSYENEERASEILSKIWAQLSERFADYDEKLIFDIMNEPRIVGSKNEWTGTPEERDVINRLNRTALDVIRNSGGNNKNRYVMITTCCASVLEDNCNALIVPDDEHIIVAIHYYYSTAHRSEYPDCEKRFNLSDYIEINKNFKRLYETFIEKGVGVCMAEFGWTDRENLNNLTHKAKWYVQCLSKYGMSCMVWDNGGDFRLIDRNNLTAEFPEYVSAVTKE
ncbi:MAG: glycoside hydrolase family 5 protein [Clostridia bacterium]|nr:glycoside hydrolase family 5 protein [Clostridia bacterium]